jgi:hypothetical protein
MHVKFEYHQELETIHRDINTHAAFTVEAEVEGDEVQILSIEFKVPGAFMTIPLRVPAETSMNREDNLMMGLFREKSRMQASKKLKQLESQQT